MKFEYKIVGTLMDKNAMAETLKSLGAEGWALVVADSINQTFVFKRPLPE